MIRILSALRAEHDELAKVLDVLEQEVESLAEDGRLNRDIVDEVLDYCRGTPALVHHPKEDLICARLRHLAAAEDFEPVAELVAEHEALAALTDELAAALDNLPEEAGAERGRFVRLAETFLARQRAHIRAEDAELVPLARRCLSRADWAELDRRARALEAPHEGLAFARRFARLGREIVEHERAARTRRDTPERAP